MNERRSGKNFPRTSIIKPKGRFGKELRQARMALGLTQKEVAAKLEVSQVTISNLELGRQEPSSDTIKALSRLLRVKP